MNIADKKNKSVHSAKRQCAQKKFLSGYTPNTAMNAKKRSMGTVARPHAILLMSVLGVIVELDIVNFKISRNGRFLVTTRDL